MVRQMLAGIEVAADRRSGPPFPGEVEVDPPDHRAARSRRPIPVPSPPDPFALDERPLIEERDLLARVRAGEEAAFARLFELHWQGVYRLLMRLVGDPDEAGDLAQEVFVQLYRRPPDGEGTPLRAWLYRVGLNRGYNALRADRRRRGREHAVARDPAAKLDDARGVSDVAFTEAANRAEERDLVRRILVRLPERQRDCLALRAEGLSYAEIAAAVGVAPASVGTLLARAERAFKRAYLAQRGGM